MRQLNGYALLGEGEAQSREGIKGKELIFGHDEQGKPYVYRIRLFVANDRLFVAEAGGAKELMERYRSNIDWMLGTLKID